MSLPEGPITCLFTDIVGSTQMSRHLPDAEYKRVTAEHDARLRTCIEKQGHEVDTAGDSFFATFHHARQALDCAVAMQTTLCDDPIVGAGVDEEGKPKQWPVRIRIGVYRAARDVFLNAAGKYRDREVNLASRIGAIGQADQILVSKSAQQGLEGEFKWHPWPGRYLKDFDTPQDVYELMWDGRVRSAPGARFLPDWYRRELNQFVGRKDMLAHIRDWLRANSYPLYTLQGFGGIGKTHLAVETILTVGSLFPGGSVFVALDREITGNDAHAITPALLAAAIARAANAPEDVRIDPEKHLAAWFAARKPTLLILDNWESAANTPATTWLGQFLNETPAVRCLVTSRVIMGLTNMGQNQPIPALPLPADTAHLENNDAYDLFVTRTQQRDPDCPLHNQNSLLRILRATSGIPLGIELAAARIVDYPLETIAKGLEQSLLDWQRTRDDLGDVRPDAERHSSLDASLNWSLKLLPPDEQSAFPRLGLFASDFDAATAQETADIPEACLLRWHRASLLTRTADRTRYQLLPVVREYALRHLSDADTWRKRHIAYYQNLARENGGVDGRNLNNAAKRRVLDAEWRNIVGATEDAERLQEWFVVQDMAAKLTNYFDLRGLWSERVQIGLRALAAARADNAKQNEGVALNNLGIVYRAQGRWEEAIAAYEQSLIIRREFGDRVGEGQTLNNLGMVYDSQGRWEEAIAAYEQALVIHREFHDRIPEGRALNNLGNVYKAQGRWEEAIAAYEQSLIIRREFGDRVGEGQTLNNLGSVYHSQGRWAEALAAYEQSLLIKREFGDRVGEGQTLNNLGVVYQAQGRWEEAIAAYEQSLPIFRELKARTYEGATLNNLGVVYQAQGRWEEALAAYEQSLVIKREFGDRVGEGQTLENVALLYNTQGDTITALQWARQSLAVLETTQDTRTTAEMRDWITRLEQA